jgi:hypothetical protein
MNGPLHKMHLPLTTLDFFPQARPAMRLFMLEYEEKRLSRRFRIPALCQQRGTSGGAQEFAPAGAISMLMTKERRPAIRTLRGWAISVLQEAGAICECEEHGWMQDRADPHARERAIEIARRDPPAGVSPEEAVIELRDVMDSIGDTCPECLPQSSVSG